MSVVRETWIPVVGVSILILVLWAFEDRIGTGWALVAGFVSTLAFYALTVAALVYRGLHR